VNAADWLSLLLWVSVPALLAILIARPWSGRRSKQRWAKWFFWMGLPLATISILLGL
jgi:hypothetical protein